MTLAIKHIKLYVNKWMQFNWISSDTSQNLELFDLFDFCLPIIRGSLNKFPYFFCVGTFIDSAHIKL